MPAPAQSTVASVLHHVDANLAASRATLFDLWHQVDRAQPAYAAECAKAAEWWRTQLAGLGFDAAVRPTAGHPVVVAHLSGPSDYDGPHILFYGHYDVQPVIRCPSGTAIRSTRNTSMAARQALRRPRGGR